MPKSLVNITKDHPATVSVPITLKCSILIYANVRLPWDLGHPAHTPSDASLQLSPPLSCGWGCVLVLLCTCGGGTGAPVHPRRGYWCSQAPLEGVPVLPCTRGGDTGASVHRSYCCFAPHCQPDSGCLVLEALLHCPPELQTGWLPAFLPVTTP